MTKGCSLFAGLFLRNPAQPLSPADPPQQLANYTALEAQDYQAADFNCNGTDRPGYCHLLGQPEASPVSVQLCLHDMLKAWSIMDTGRSGMHALKGPA